MRLEDPWLGFSHGGTMGFTAMFDVSGGYSGGTMDWTWSVPALFLNFPGQQHVGNRETAVGGDGHSPLSTPKLERGA